jgi:hypothetical protein
MNFMNEASGGTGHEAVAERSQETWPNYGIRQEAGFVRAFKYGSPYLQDMKVHDEGQEVTGRVAY